MFFSNLPYIDLHWTYMTGPFLGSILLWYTVDSVSTRKVFSQKVTAALQRRRRPRMASAVQCSRSMDNSTKGQCSRSVSSSTNSRNKEEIESLHYPSLNVSYLLYRCELQERRPMPKPKCGCQWSPIPQWPIKKLLILPEAHQPTRYSNNTSLGLFLEQRTHLSDFLVNRVIEEEKLVPENLCQMWNLWILIGCIGGNEICGNTTQVNMELWELSTYGWQWGGGLQQCQEPSRWGWRRFRHQLSPTDRLCSVALRWSCRCPDWIQISSLSTNFEHL